MKFLLFLLVASCANNDTQPVEYSEDILRSYADHISVHSDAPTPVCTDIVALRQLNYWCFLDPIPVPSLGDLSKMEVLVGGRVIERSQWHWDGEGTAIVIDICKSMDMVSISFSCGGYQ
jgi:hypothetical protein